MQKKILYSITFMLTTLLLYNSVYFKKLSTKKSSQSMNSIDFNDYADSLYKCILKNESSIEINKMLSLNNSNPDSLFQFYGHRLGIGTSAYFMVHLNGKVLEKTESGLKILTSPGHTFDIDVKYIFGNAIRDASGLVKITDFKTNAEFNKLSEALNFIIREKSIPSKMKLISVGDQIIVTGAVRLNKNEKSIMQILPVNIM